MTSRSFLAAPLLTATPIPKSQEMTPQAQQVVTAVEPHVKNRVFLDWDPLRKYNMILFVIHIVVAIVLIIYFKRTIKGDSQTKGINLDLFTHAFKMDPNTNFFQVVSEKVGGFSENNVATLIVTFFAITAGFHLLYALNPGNVYLDAVKKGNNFWRWIEYGISATIMIVVIAILSGVKDINNYILMIVISLGIMSTGQWFETATGKSKWIPIIVGFTLMMGVFTVIFASFRRRIREVQALGFKLPTWIYLVVFMMFGFYASFGFVPVAQMVFRGNYRKYEYAYLTLSLISKVSLGVLVAVGFAQRASSSQPS